MTLATLENEADLAGELLGAALEELRRVAHLVGDAAEAGGETWAETRRVLVAELLDPSLETAPDVVLGRAFNRVYARRRTAVRRLLAAHASSAEEASAAFAELRALRRGLECARLSAAVRI